jgi:hypothetical protein
LSFDLDRKETLCMPSWRPRKKAVQSPKLLHPRRVA